MRSLLAAHVRRVALFTGLLLAAACATDSVSAPMLTPDQADLVKVATPANGEQVVKVGGRQAPLKANVSASAFIGPEGGVLRIPALGFELVVPRGAVADTVKFRVTALAGSALSYEFEPHGAKFQVPLIFRQDHSYSSIAWGREVSGGYFADSKKINQNGKNAKVAEVLPGRWNGTWIEFEIKHFSGYLVSCA